MSTVLASFPTLDKTGTLSKRIKNTLHVFCRIFFIRTLSLFFIVEKKAPPISGRHLFFYFLVFNFEHDADNNSGDITYDTYGEGTEQYFDGDGDADAADTKKTERQRYESYARDDTRAASDDAADGNGDDGAIAVEMIHT